MTLNVGQGLLDSMARHVHCGGEPEEHFLGGQRTPGQPVRNFCIYVHMMHFVSGCSHSENDHGGCLSLRAANKCASPPEH